MSLVNSFPGGNGGSSGLPSGGTTGQILAKKSSTDGDAEWVNQVSTSDCYKTGDTAETALADNDKIPFYDTSASGKRSSTWSNIKSVLKTYFDTLYSTVKTKGTPTSGGTALSLVTTGDMYNWNNPSIPVVANQFDKANIYSTSEKIIGCWTDGRPVYQKVVSFGALTNVSTDTYVKVASGVSINQIVSAKGWFRSGTTWYAIIPYNTDSHGYVGISGWTNAESDTSSKNKFGLFYKGNFGWVNEAVVVYQYTKTTDAANSYKYADENEYSTTEHIVGKWIDGKPVYQKTIDCGALPNNTTKSVQTGITNPKRIISFNGYSVRTTDGTIFPLPQTPNMADTAVASGIKVSFSNYGTIININTGQDRSNFTETYITIKYTKTTD